MSRLPIPPEEIGRGDLPRLAMDYLQSVPGHPVTASEIHAWLNRSRAGQLSSPSAILHALRQLEAEGTVRRIGDTPPAAFVFGSMRVDLTGSMAPALAGPRLYQALLRAMRGVSTEFVIEGTPVASMMPARGGQRE